MVVRSRLGEAPWEAAFAEGQAMTFEEAVEYALGETDSPTTHVPEVPAADQPPVRLTPRQKEVAVLVTRRLTNRQIARELVLSRHTVDKHVKNILKKLGLRSRAQIASRLGGQ